MKEGVVKFQCDWARKPLVVEPGLLELVNLWRSRLRDLGLFGALPHGVGFGNISVRAPGPGQERGPTVAGAGAPPSDETLSFLISGSGTGRLGQLKPENLSHVFSFDLGRNRLSCRGLTEASSESLSHGAIYTARRDAGAVIHVHSSDLWKGLHGRVPTTPAAIQYGTPEMAMSLMELSSNLNPGLAHTLVMGGHRDGLIAFGKDLNQVGEAILQQMISVQE